MRHLSQKYIGVRPENHAQAMFKDAALHSSGNHMVPVSNFMNAQCAYQPILLDGETFFLII